MNGGLIKKNLINLLKNPENISYVRLPGKTSIQRVQK